MKKKLAEYAVKILNAQKAFEENSAARSGVGKNIAAMSGQIKAVNASIKEVQNISMQVRILSINASVEAARAGSAGRGFSIVASEIGTLSKNTDATIKKIEESVLQMQKLLNDTVSVMDNAKGLGAEFDRQLAQCVEEAQKLPDILGENEQLMDK